MSCDPPENRSASDTTRPRNQSFFQKPALVIASPACFYCCLARNLPPCALAFYATRFLRSGPPRMLTGQGWRLLEGSKLLNKQRPRRHFYSEYWGQSNLPVNGKAMTPGAKDSGRAYRIPRTSIKARKGGRGADPRPRPAAAQLPRRAPGTRPICVTSSAADTFLPSSCFALRTSIRPPWAVTKKLAEPISETSPTLPFTAPKVRNRCLRLSKICSFLPLSVVQAPGAGLQPRMRS